MRALVVERPDRLVMAEMPRPEPGDYEALVRIRACGICNTTDWRVITGSMLPAGEYPVVLGHEHLQRVGRRTALGLGVACNGTGSELLDGADPDAPVAAGGFPTVQLAIFDHLLDSTQR